MAYFWEAPCNQVINLGEIEGIYLLSVIELSIMIHVDDLCTGG